MKQEERKENILNCKIKMYLEKNNKEIIFIYEASIKRIELTSYSHGLNKEIKNIFIVWVRMLCLAFDSHFGK